jgi:cellulose synthase/poly-beta-1,6-N-acetylglucosamine synthase-like glycosyltransferase
MLEVLWLLLALAVGLSLLSLRGERARWNYYQEMLARQGQGPAPKATVIVPVKGMEEGLKENLASLAELDYPDYELIVVAKSEADLPRQALPPRAKIVLAGEGDPGTGEKINNLLAAVATMRSESEVLAFADSDGCAGKQWLRALTAALAEPDVGAATGYRWHLPARATAAAMLRSVWNAVIAGGMGPGRNNFVWGGAAAIRVETFRALNVPAWWRGAISDDYRLSQAVRAAGLRIAFAPGALAASTDSTGMFEFLDWIRRQMRITRFYAPRLWWLALFAHLVYCAAMAGGLGLALGGSVPAALALAIQLGTGWWKGYRRIALARLAMPEHRAWFDRYAAVHVALVPAGTWLWLWSSLAAGFSGTITWRGYRLTLRTLPPPAG